MHSTEYPFEVSIAGQVADGIEELKKNPYHLVFLDVNLPDAHGEESFKKIHGEFPQLPIIIMTSEDDDHLAAGLVRQGAQDYIVKGEYDLKQLQRNILYALERGDLRQEQQRVSEKQFQEIVEQLGEGIFILDNECRVLYMNQAAETIFGVPLDEMSGRIFGYPIVENGSMEINFVRRENEQRFAELRSVNIRWGGKEAKLVAVHDMTDLKGLERLKSEILIRQEIENTLRSRERALAASSNGILILDPHEKEKPIIYSNPAFYKLAGYSGQEILGKDWSFLWGEQTNPNELKKLEEALDRREECEVLLKVYRKNKNIFWSEVIISPVWDEQKQLRHYVVVLNDVTDLIERGKMLEKQKALLQKANQELDRFVHTASHDLQAPLRAVSTFAQFLGRDYSDKLDQEGQENLTEILRGTQRMQRLIEDLLKLSRISRIQNPYEEANIREVVQEAWERIKPDASLFGIRLNVAESMPVVKCDRIKITEVFANLLDNAVKFSRHASNESDSMIEVGCQDRGACYCFFVRDHGIGIPKEHHEDIFNMFKRLHSEKDYKGTGAGLAILKRIIEDHEGSLWVESNRGEGACFFFTIQKILSNVKRSGNCWWKVV